MPSLYEFTVYQFTLWCWFYLVDMSSWAFAWGNQQLTQTSLYSHRSRLEAWNFGFKKKRDCTVCVTKTKTLNSCTVTSKLICIFVFACAVCWFTDAVAQLWCATVMPSLQYNFIIYIQTMLCLKVNRNGLWLVKWIEPPHGKNQRSAKAKTKAQTSFAVTAKLISAFVFDTQIVQFLYFLNPKFPASYHLLWLYSSVCVGPGRNQIVGFLTHRLNCKHSDILIIVYENEPLQEKTSNLGFRSGLTQTGLYSHRNGLEAWNFGFRKKRHCTVHLVKEKALISCAVTAPLFWHRQKSSFLLMQLIAKHSFKEFHIEWPLV